MKLLLDTHVFLWLSVEPDRLSDNMKIACENPENRLYLSLVSPWEIQIKQQLGKLQLHAPLAGLIETQVRRNGMILLPVKLEHIYALSELPSVHKDPFDRLLIAQAGIESMHIVSSDKKISRYQINIIN